MITLPTTQCSLKYREVSDLIIQHAAALGEAFGVPDREMARSALSLVLVIAEKAPDGDGALAEILQSVGGKK